MELYNAVALATAGTVIRSYSTSFTLASRLLDRGVRGRIESVYGLVRLADEIVDGTAAAARLEPDQIAKRLDGLEQETETALSSGYSSNLIVHAFALTARDVGIGPELTRPFFGSMRADLTLTEHTQESFTDYVYGSAEVIGLMCLRCFLYKGTVSIELEETLMEGARKLGAAFQKVNFLRDLGQDFESLGRSYFPDLRVENFSNADKDRLLADIEADLRISAAAIPFLPTSSRYAVALAQEIFAELVRRLNATPASELLQTRVRVPNPIKLALAARVMVKTRVPGQLHFNSGGLSR
nr:phytoene/squalene synthase family protein [Arthrobacter roseus]